MRVFVKKGSPVQLKSEYEGLEALRHVIPNYVVHVMGLDDEGLHLEHIVEGTQQNWEEAGKALAKLHSSSPNLHYGWSVHNFIGRLEQQNSWRENWEDFWIHERLLPQFSLAVKKGFTHLSEYLDDQWWLELCSQIIINRGPCLIHGDLWRGNILFRRDGRPVFIDPSVYVGVGGVDLSMTLLFGGFPHSFYRSYYAELDRDELSEGEKMMYQLYYLLVHLNMFGSSYLNQVRGTISELRRL